MHYHGARPFVDGSGEIHYNDLLNTSDTKANRVGLGDAVVMGLSSSGPSQTLAVSLAALVAVSGYGGVIPILICFVPMMGIAIAYQRLNRWDQSSGATYTWVAKVFHPYLGFLSGWMILLYYTLGTTTLTIPAGIYTLDLIAPSQVDSHWAIFLVGAAWNVLITAFAVIGLKIVARFEWAIVIFEYTVLLAVAAIALSALHRGLGAAHFSWAWFSLSGMGGMKGLMGGILIACFMYSGWDASIYVNEETVDRANNPGRAALASVVMLALMYSVSTFAFQAVLTPAEMQSHAGNVLSAVSSRLLMKPWDSAMALVVLTGTLASLQSAVVSAARVGLAMSRDRVMPGFFQRLTANSGSPWAATCAMSAFNLCLLALALGTSNIAAALNNAASSLGLISIVFYGITAAAALWQARAGLASNASNLFLGGVMPSIGVIFSLWVLIEAVATGAVTIPVMLYGLGSIAVGAAVAFYLDRIKGVGFFNAVAVGTKSTS
jgi:amino acid transporter